MLDDIIKIHEELEEVNDLIIDQQKEVIKELKEQNKHLRGLIEKYLLNGKTFEEIKSFKHE